MFSDLNHLDYLGNCDSCVVLICNLHVVLVSPFITMYESYAKPKRRNPKKSIVNHNLIMENEMSFLFAKCTHRNNHDLLKDWKQ